MLRYLIFFLFFSISTSVFSQLLSENYRQIISASRNTNIDQLIRNIQQEEQSLESKALVAELNFLKGRNDLAEEVLSQLLNSSEDDISRSSELYARLLKNNGLVLWNAGKEDQAMDYLRQALNRYQNIAEVSKENIADVYNNIGLVYSSYNPAKATSNYEKALEIYETETQKNIDKIIQISINLSLVEVNQGNFIKALRLLNQALNSWKAEHQAGLPSEAFIKANIGNVYLQTEQLILAKDYFQEAQEIYQRQYGTRHAELANVFAQMSDLSLKNKDYKESLSLIQRALKANSFAFDQMLYSFNPDVDDVNKLNLQVVLLMRKASILEDFYFGYSLKKSHLLFALDAIDLADRLLVKMRSSTSNRKDLFDLSALAAELYEDGQRIALHLHEVTLIGNDFAEKAFTYAEKSKSAMLFNAMIESEAKSFAGIPKELLDKEKALVSEMSYLNSQISLESDQVELKYLRDRYFQIKTEFENFINDLEKVYPDYFDLKHQNRKISVKAIQRKLLEGEAIFEYSMAPKANEIYLYHITENDFSFRRIYFRKDILKYIKAYRNTMVYNLEGSFKEISAGLFSYLFPKGIESRTSKLIIIPDGELATIPFDALIQNDSKDISDDFYNLEYLIRDYDISYAYSAGLNQQKLTQKQGDKSLLIAPVDFGSTIASLPASEEEGSHFQNWSTTLNLEVDAMVRSAATEVNFKALDLDQYRFIHLATHGTVNMESSDLSGIFFYESDETLSADGVLYAGEIYGLRINAKLVVLSACETGLGTINRGEGVLGLGQAFAYSGAENLILSLWKVADNSTSMLMKYFYSEGLDANAESFSSSLREAKLELINSDYAAPYYWAPFILWGK